MTTLTLPVSANFVLHVDLTDHRLGTHIAFRTQWTDSKNPGATQTQYGITLQPEQLKQLGEFLIQHT